MKIFLSYARLDDRKPPRRVSKFRKAFETEVSQTIGRECEVLVDGRSVRWGSDWRQDIERLIKASDFFVSLVTPSYFNSRMCIYELQFALAEGKKVLPIYFRDCDSLSSSFKEEGNPPGVNRMLNETSRKLTKLQMRDYRKLLNKKVTSSDVQKFLAGLAREIARRNDRPGA